MAADFVNGVFTDQAAGDSLDVILANMAVASKLRLYQNTLVPDRTTLETDFAGAEADFNGYPAGGIALTMSTGVLDSLGDIQSISQRALFIATDALVPNTIGGAWLEDPAGKIVAHYPLTNPVVLAVAGAFLAATLFMKPDGKGTLDVDS
jgi:hypothetical protein